MPERTTGRARIGIVNPRSATYLLAFVVVFAVLTIFQPTKFLSLTNIQQMAFQLPEFGVLALAMMVAMLSGGIDLSITFTTNIAGIASALVLLSLSYGGAVDFKHLLQGIMAEGITATGVVTPTGITMLAIVLLSVLVALAVAGLCGLLNGVLVAKVKIPPILATLGTMKLYEGISLVITRGSPITNFPKSFLFLGSGSLFHIPFPMIVFILCAVGVSVFLRKTPLGFGIYAVGENPVAARFSGLLNERILIKTYLVTGLLAGVAAVLMIARVDSVKVGYGNSYLLQAVLVVILGGVSDRGGSGSVLGVVFGILILRMISSGFNIIGFSNYFRNVIWGSMLVLVTIVNYSVPAIVDRLKAKKRHQA
jgi:simple sugar transport system permease protein